MFDFLFTGMHGIFINFNQRVKQQIFGIDSKQIFEIEHEQVKHPSYENIQVVWLYSRICTCFMQYRRTLPIFRYVGEFKTFYKNNSFNGIKGYTLT